MNKIKLSSIVFGVVTLVAAPSFAGRYDRSGNDYDERQVEIQKRLDDSQTYGRHTSECSSYRYTGRDACEAAATSRDVWYDQKAQQKRDEEERRR